MSKLGLVAIASTRPVEGSIATTAPWYDPRASAATRCRSGSRVSSTFDPRWGWPVMIWSTRERNCELAVPDSSRFIACSMPVADCSTGLM